ncbi:hypothetical protein LXL04_009578 [Taraxacum kok-saghyz]
MVAVGGDVNIMNSGPCSRLSGTKEDMDDVRRLGSPHTTCIRCTECERGCWFAWPESSIRSGSDVTLAGRARPGESRQCGEGAIWDSENAIASPKVLSFWCSLFPLFSLKKSSDFLNPKPDDDGDSFQCRRFLPVPTTPACSSAAASVPPSIPAPNLSIFLSPISISLSPIYQFPVADFILLFANSADFAVSGFYHSDFTQISAAVWVALGVCTWLLSDWGFLGMAKFLASGVLVSADVKKTNSLLSADCRRLSHLFFCRGLQMWSADCRRFASEKTNSTLGGLVYLKRLVWWIISLPSPIRHPVIHHLRSPAMGNCQAVDNASLVLQTQNGRADRFYSPISAAEIMKLHPGHCVALLLTTTLYSSPPSSSSSDNHHRQPNNPALPNQPLRVTRIKLLRPTDNLVLGHAYRLITNQEVMKGLKAKKNGNFNNNKYKDYQPLESAGKNSANSACEATSTRSGQFGKTHRQSLYINWAMQMRKPDKHWPRTAAPANSTSTGSKPRGWHPISHLKLGVSKNRTGNQNRTNNRKNRNRKNRNRDNNRKNRNRKNRTETVTITAKTATAKTEPQPKPQPHRKTETAPQNLGNTPERKAKWHRLFFRSGAKRKLETHQIWYSRHGCSSISSSAIHNNNRRKQTRGIFANSVMVTRSMDAFVWVAGATWYCRETADVKKQTVFLLQTADVWSISSVAEDCRCGPQTTDVLTSKKQTKHMCHISILQVADGLVAVGGSTAGGTLKAAVDSTNYTNTYLKNPSSTYLEISLALYRVGIEAIFQSSKRNIFKNPTSTSNRALANGFVNKSATLLSVWT